MNEEIYDKRALIKQEINNIKISTLQTQLLSQFNHESNLDNFLSSLPKQVVINSLQRFEKKLKGYQQIEKDLPDNLIPNEESYVILPKLNTLRLKLAILYAERLGNENIEEKNSYNEIKLFIFEILKIINFNLKLKYFDLSIKLLHKTIEDPSFNKEFIGVFDLLKLFVNERNYLPSEADLQYISNLGSDANEEDIKKCFYGIIRELNKKILFQNLLNILLEIIKNQNNSPLMQFNIIFITKCLNNVSSLEAGDLNQVIGLVYRALEAYNELAMMNKAYTVFKKIFNQKSLNDNLKKFELDFKEKISEQIINDPIRHYLPNHKKNTVWNNTQELDITNYFPMHLNNEKIQARFVEAQYHFNEILKNNLSTNDRLAHDHLKGRLAEISNKAFEIFANVKAIASDTKENLQEFAETSADRLTGILKKNYETSYQEENVQNDMNLSNSLNQAKAKLLPIKEKLNTWNLILIFNVDENYYNPLNQIETSQFDLNQCLESVDNFSGAINEKFTRLIQQILEEFEKINTTLKEKDCWFAKSELAKPSLFDQIFYRGYFNSDYTIKKIKSLLGNRAVYADINNFILGRSFWSLLSYGIVRWPWKNKIVFARTWAEQFCIPEVITQTDELKTKLLNNSSDELLEKVIALSKVFLPYQSEVVVHNLDDFKKFIGDQLGQLEALEQNIDALFDEKINFSSANTSRFFKAFNSPPPDAGTPCQSLHTLSSILAS
ncbi:MAG: hypothetical protein RJA83_1235 [Pseudomonadota bacterium]|jgi:hypothetical protein